MDLERGTLILTDKYTKKMSLKKHPIQRVIKF